MIAALRLLGLRGIIAVLAIATVFALLVRVDWLTADRDTARAEVAEAVRVNSVLSASLATARNDLNVVNTVLSGERDRAVAAERRASELRERIARDAGTARDGPTAPVLRDTIQALGQPGERS